ncbi:hypothetical protein LTR86_010261 [Recurvomyces mirabilis]|nr:hypothetical protein LTR86_010261 [Recurvomyces mirabilis]
MAISSQPRPDSSQASIGPARMNRNVQPFPASMLDHCTVCLEEQLFSQAISLLSSGLTSGTCTLRPSQVPPMPHLALLATVAVHPSLTTRTADPTKPQAAHDALRYLRHVSRLLSPRAAGLDKAFHFTAGSERTDRSKRAKDRKSETAEVLPINDANTIRSQYVDQESIWSNADDFWSIVGWAFNCSVKYKHRWQRWRAWLELMLEVLEADLNERTIDGTATDSLLAQYLLPIGQGRNSKRRLMRAILADGSTKALAEFHEIWRNETGLAKTTTQTANKKRKLDLDNDEFGDYFDESDEDSPATTARRSRSATAFSSRKASRQPSSDEDESSEDDSTVLNDSNVLGVEAFGGMDSIALRRRILALLVRFCSSAPELLLDVEDLFDLYTEFIRPLRLAAFGQFVVPAKAYLSIDTQCSLIQMLLRPLLTSSAPTYDANALTQADFEYCYAPFTASTTSAVDNAKVSLLIEGLVRLLWRTGDLQTTPRLRELVEAGIEERQAKGEFDGRRKTGVKAMEDEEAVQTMQASGERLRSVLDLCAT